MAMPLTGQRGYFTAKAEYRRSGGVTVNRLVRRLGGERYAAFIRGYLFYLYDAGMIDDEEAQIVMWAVRREHWLAGFPRSIRAGYRPYGL
jgi:hypothetical protein